MRLDDITSQSMIYIYRDWLFKIKAQKPFAEDLAQSPVIQDKGVKTFGSKKAPRELSWGFQSGYFVIRIHSLALACVAQWIECWPMNWKVTSSIPSQGTFLGCGPGHELGCTRGSLSYIDVCLPPFSKNKQTKCLKKKIHNLIYFF